MTRVQFLFKEFLKKHKDERLEALLSTAFALDFELEHNSGFHNMTETPEEQAKIFKEEFRLLASLIVEELGFNAKLNGWRRATDNTSSTRDEI